MQIGDENVHRVRALMDEVFGDENFVSNIAYQTTPYATSDYLPAVYDSILWYGRSTRKLKYRQLFKDKSDLRSVTRFNLLVSPDKAGTRSMTRDEVDSWRLLTLEEGEVAAEVVYVGTRSEGDQRDAYAELQKLFNTLEL